MHAVAGLCINLQVRVKVVISYRSFRTKIARIFAATAIGRARGALLPLILVDTRAIVSGSQPGREAAAVVAGAEIPDCRRLALQGWVVGSKWERAGARTGLAIVCRDAEAAPGPMQKSEALDVGKLHAVKLRIHAVRNVVENVAVKLRILRSFVVGISKIVNRLTQLFVEEAGLKLPIRLEVVLVQHIVIVGMLWLKIGVPNRDAERVRALIFRHI